MTDRKKVLSKSSENVRMASPLWTEVLRPPTTEVTAVRRPRYVIAQVNALTQSMAWSGRKGSVTRDTLESRARQQRSDTRYGALRSGYGTQRRGGRQCIVQVILLSDDKMCSPNIGEAKPKNRVLLTRHTSARFRSAGASQRWESPHQRTTTTCKWWLSNQRLL